VPRPVTITLPDVLDDHAVSELRSTLRALARDADCELRLDGSTVADVSLRGLALLVALRQLARTSGARVLLVDPSPSLASAVRAFGLERRLGLTEAAAEVA
jgi:anti-anti-sigma regulatory factor